MKRDIGKILSILAVLIVLTLLGALLVPGKHSAASEPLPNPNGYDAFVKSSEMLVGNFAEFKALTNEELEALLNRNTNALQIARAGFGQPGRVTFQFSEGDITNQLIRLTALKSLAHAFAAEGEFAHLKGRTNEAVQCYLDAIRLGQQGTRGGLIVHRLFGVGAETIGLRSLDTLSNLLSAELSRLVARELEGFDATEESAQDTFANEAYWNRRVFGLTSRVTELFGYRGVRKVKEMFVLRQNEMVRRRRATALHFAARAYELEKGKRPGNVSELVPEYLKAVPLDPLTGETLAYTP